MKIDPDLEQVRDLLESSPRILIAVPPEVDLEAIHAAWVLTVALKKARPQSSVDLLIDEKAADKADPALNLEEGRVSRVFPPPLIVKIPLKKARLKKVDYATEGDFLKLSIHPAEGKCLPESIKFETGTFPYSLLVALGVSRLVDLGRLYQECLREENSLPIINLDFQKENTLFGTINIVYTEVSTLTELVVYLVKELGYTLDSWLAQVLMTGLVNKTRGFTQNVTPQIFRTAASLSALGAEPRAGLRDIPPAISAAQGEEPIR